MNDKPEMVGEIVGSFLLPAKVLGRTGKATKGIKKGPTVHVRVATQPKGLTIPGRVLNEYSAIKQGPLGKFAKGDSPTTTAQATFSGYRYSRVKLNEPVVVHRFHNNGKPVNVWNPQKRQFEIKERGAQEFGGFWTLDETRGAAAARIDAAVLPEWGNSMTHRTSVELPAGTIINVGEAGGQRGFFVGGSSQVMVEGMRGSLAKGARVVERVRVQPSP